MATVLFDEQVEIPLGITNLADFRRWALSEDFPQHGRIDYVAGRIEVDRSPEVFLRMGHSNRKYQAVLSSESVSWILATP